ncbi:hypothetical protein Tco_1532181 [Tanacetum coccineum]
MIIEDLDLELKIDAMMRDFLESPSQWKELSKETSSKILPSGDGSRREALKPNASLVSKGKLKSEPELVAIPRQRRQKLDLRVVEDFNKMFYNSLGSVPNRSLRE